MLLRTPVRSPGAMKLVLGALLLLAALAPAESFFTLPSVRFPTTHTAPRAVCLPGASPRRPQVARLVMMASPYDAMTVAVLRENLVTRGPPPPTWPPRPPSPLLLPTTCLSSAGYSCRRGSPVRPLAHASLILQVHRRARS